MKTTTRTALPAGLLILLAIGPPVAADLASDLVVHYEFEYSYNPGYNSVGPDGTACGG